MSTQLQIGKFFALTPTWTIRDLSTPATPTYLKTWSSISRFLACWLLRGRHVPRLKHDIILV
jgi:hypothetical protein